MTPQTTLEERLFGAIWNKLKKLEQPLWWCLDEQLKQVFRETFTAELERSDPTVAPPWGRGT